MMNTSMKRIVSVVLMLAMLISCTNLSWAAEASVAKSGGSGNYLSMTLGQIISENYKNSLSEKERAIISLPAVAGDTINAVFPTDEDGLLEVDTDNKTVRAKLYTDSYGNIWEPTVATLMYNGGSAGFGISKSGDGSYVGSFASVCSTDNYTVEMEYTLFTEPSAETQMTVINAPMGLVSGIQLLEAISDQKDALNGISSNIDKILQFRNGFTLPYGISYSIKDEAIRGVDDIVRERDRNYGETKLQTLLYKAEREGAVQFLMNSSEELKTETESLVKKLIDIYYLRFDLVFLKGFFWNMYTQEQKNQVNTLELAVNTLESLLNALHSAVHNNATLNVIGLDDVNNQKIEDPCAGDYHLGWQSFADGKAAVKSDATDAQLSALNTAVTAQGEVSDHTGMQLLDRLTVAKTTVLAGVEQCKVNVSVRANVIGRGSADTAKTVAVSYADTATLTLDRGISRADVLREIENSGIEASAVKAWGESHAYYNINKDNYSVTIDGVGDTLEENINVTITYSPKNYTVSFDYGREAMSVPYGYNFTLPTYKSETGSSDGSYDYIVNGNGKRESVVIRITENVTVDRTVGSATDKYSIIDIVTDGEFVGADLTDEEIAVLKSLAFDLDADADYKYFRTPQSGDVVVSGGAGCSFEVTAADIYGGPSVDAVWTADRCELIANGEVIDSISMNGGKCTVLAEKAFDTARIVYTLDLTAAAAERARYYISLPDQLAGEAAAQTAEMDALVKIFDRPGVVNNFTYDNLSLVSSEMCSEEAYRTFKSWLSVAFNGKTLIMREYTDAYKSGGLAYYYGISDGSAEDNYTLIKNQVNSLKSCLNTLWADEKFQQTIEENETIQSKISSVIEVREAINELDFDNLGVNPAIDQTSPNLGKLASSLQAAKGHTVKRTFGSDFKVTYLSGVDKAATGHSFNGVVTEPTPDAQGYTTYTCTNCGYSYTDNYTEYNGSAVIASGICGDDLTWTLTVDGTLTISGTGEMYNYTSHNAPPWGQNIKTAVIENGVTSIGIYAFYKCSSLVSVTIPNSVTIIRNDAFYECSSLVSVTIPDSVTSIEDGAFFRCSSLVSITIPNSVTSINRYTFSGCRSLTTVTIPDSVTIIGYEAFYQCSSLTSVMIPNSVKRIVGYAFWACGSLATVTIPDGVTSIDEYTFSDCHSLTTVTIPDSVTSIGNCAFQFCSSLTTVTIPDSVTSIGNYAFRYCSSLTAVTIPDSVTSIGESTFYQCSLLTAVTIPDSVTSIGNSAFRYCSSLTDVYYSGTEDKWNNISIGSDNECLTNATIHFREPDECEHDPIEEIITAPTCGAEGEAVVRCSVCGEEFDRQVIPATGKHTPGEREIIVAPTCSTDGEAVTKCAVCGAEIWRETLIQTGAHLPIVKEIIAEPTCVSDGHAAMVCETCGLDLGMQTIPATGVHTPGEVEYSSYPNCGNDGSGVIKCTVCDQILENLHFPATGDHTPGGQTEIVKYPTCAAEGESVIRCTVCRQVIEHYAIPVTEDHMPGAYETVVEPTCGAEGEAVELCTVCGKELRRMPISATGMHIRGEMEIVTSATCGADGEYIVSCQVCGEEMERHSIPATGQHTYGDPIITTEPTCGTVGEYLERCTVCGNVVITAIPETGAHEPIETEIITAPTCVSDGYVAVVCKVCGRDLGQNTIPATGVHTPGEAEIHEPTCANHGTYRVVCTVCGEELENRLIPPTEDHVPGEPETVKSPTCALEGEAVIKCMNCGKELERTAIPATDMHMRGGEEIITAPSCMTEGEAVVKCTECGKELERYAIPAIGEHTFGEPIITVEPTCVSHGKYIIRCAVCGTEIEGEIDPTGVHTPGEAVTVTEPTCGTAGEAVVKCSVCGEELERRTLPATGTHTAGAPEIVTNPTCVKDGETVIICKVCGKELDRMSIPATGEHTPGEPEIVRAATCTDKGEAVVKCTVCGEIIEIVEIAMIPHDYTGNAPMIISHPTCTEDGITEVTCNICKQRIQLITPAYGHDGEEFVVEPTCVKDGYRAIVCWDCGEILEMLETLPATGEHTPGEPEIVRAATCTDKGEAVVKCTVCGCIIETYKLETAPHNYEEQVVAPTADEKGYTVHTCTECGDSYIDGYTDALGYELCDINGDGVINSKDSNLLKRIILGAYVPDEAEFKAADINGDGVINTKDSNLLKRKIANG